MSDTTLIKELARTLRYRELPDLIGKVVRINSLQMIEEDIRATLGSVLPPASLTSSESRFVEGAMAKYGILDLTFQAPRELLDTEYESGLSLLKELRFLVVNPDEAEARAEIAALLGDEPNDPACLSELHDGIQKSQVVMLLFLETEPLKDRSQRILGKLPPDFLPRDFVIKDACVTNSGFVWFHKHFYL